jgi:hypothetical protein
VSKFKVRAFVFLGLAGLLMIFPVKVFVDGGGRNAHEHKLALPKFAGRVFPEQDVEWGSNPRVIVFFEETETWGDDGIMTFAKSDPNVVLKAERPDPKTKGFFQHAEKRINILGINLFRQISDVRMEDGELVAVSIPDKWLVPLLAVYFSVCLIIFTGAAIFGLVWPRKEELPRSVAP